ncbi:VWA domain-containing protein [Thiothrix subterranea]|uniref:VWA domain-containing protein n=1 Tax=Thiothrix subterranea TaxID=2735563 RepID=A0AA51MJU8_9GAMM|nr:VWA domain-containing protein [Thiothrix subterranea]MDQ5770292.1 VWA domain-containing protein [Thiothrix subterranea]WML85834.1 VWA domain-containing protein [Thiothrix subterranea]
MLNNLHFLHPEWLWLLLVLPLVLGMKWFQARQQGGWERIVDKQLMPFVLSGTAGSWGWLPLAWLSLALLVAIVAMAGPAWEKREVPVFRDQQALVVAMDFSASMYADDEKPNRITLARFKLLDILNARQDAQNGLVVFAGDAFVVTPLTDDIATIQEQVKNLAPDIMPAPGSLLTPAIERSVELLQQAGMKTGSILLMTDGVADTESAVAAADKAWSMGYNVSVLSLGTADGAAIPRPRGGFLLDNSGKTVIAPVNLDDLERIAKAGGGIFTQAALGDADVNALSQQWQSLSQQQLSKSQGRQTDAWVNEGYWLVLLLLPLAALTFRPGWLGVALVCILLPQPQTATAFSWDDLWLTPDQQAQEALDSGQPARASELFHNPEWKGASAYKNKDYQTAAQQYAAQQSITGQYNYANAQAKAGKFKEAIIAYKRVLEADPKHEDARNNLKIVEEALQQQQKQEEQNQKNSQKNQPQDQQGADQQQAQGAQGQDSQAPQPNNSPDQQQQAQEEDAAKQAEQEAEKAKQGEQDAEKPKQDDAEVAADDPQQREQEQATEQWLRRIPDDPSGLWRRKFQYQYQQRGAQARGDEW